MRPDQCNIVHIVGDRYDFGPEVSLKAEERLRRQVSSKKAKSFQPRDNLRLPLWKGYIECQDNKQNLEEYLLESWTSHTEWIPPECEIIVGGLKCGPTKVISAVGVRNLDALECEEHEEADNRIFAHITFSSRERNCLRAVIYATDTDILILGLKELWMHKLGRLIPCHLISQHLSSSYSNSMGSAILSAYALTGCDTVSFIFNCGKKRALKKVIDSHAILEPFAEYGIHPESN